MLSVAIKLIFKLLYHVPLWNCKWVKTISSGFNSLLELRKKLLRVVLLFHKRVKILGELLRWIRISYDYSEMEFLTEELLMWPFKPGLTNIKLEQGNTAANKCCLNDVYPRVCKIPLSLITFKYPSLIKLSENNTSKRCAVPTHVES